MEANAIGQKRPPNATENAPSRPADADLAAIIDAWPALPGAIKAGILAMVKAASEKGD